MLFNSYIFIFLFLPAVLIGWYGLNRLKQYKLANLFPGRYVFVGFMDTLMYTIWAIILSSIGLNYNVKPFL